MKREVFYFNSRPVNPIALIIAAVLAVIAFFIALPIFIAAIVVFTGIAFYMSWKFKKAMKKAAEEMEKAEHKSHLDASEMVIDITDPDKK